MKKSRFTDPQIMSVLKQAEGGMAVPELCREHGISAATVRHEWLIQYLFADIKEVQDTATEWLWTYNHERPNMALGGITPVQKLKRQMQTQMAA